ncbi:isopropylmalate/homocitrate/citramalate synthase [Actinomadura pelletieri DSM 43383]|uniref:Isopropylmalate/homocitrate/citramalate synthase n=1 Tax=Actinomadura pelletieri DSM 43383 TaxID=1120940 RepID=A0A495QU07_9ACTN|nr:hypothetical protein [Actinomadura pelletieri]RKS77012.1 isopropylmalate/homocitrate/citramalate synthase [Actinomadura pelletieri DSM 43383]
MDDVTEAQIARFREDVDRSRTPGAYEPGRWSVAPANRDPAVTGDLPEQIRLRDASMRAIESLPGVAPSAEAKLAFLRMLARSRVPEIVLAAPGPGGRARQAGGRERQAGSRGRHPRGHGRRPGGRGAHPAGRDADAVRAEVAVIREEHPDCVVHCPFVSTMDGIDRAADVGFDAVQVPVPPFGPAAGIYRASAPASRTELVAETAELVGYARARRLRVAAPITMVSFLSEETLAETVTAMADAGAQEVILFDGPGGVGPEAYGRLVEVARSAAPDLRVGVHPHNTFGLGVACAVSAARAGAAVVESSVNGYCSGTGNADLAATAAAFEALYGVRTGLRLDTLTGLARAAAGLTGRASAANQPITGRDAFCWGGADWVLVEREVDPLLHNSVEPALFGNERRIPLTSQSGPRATAAALERLGVDVDPALVPAIAERCRAELGARGGRPLTDEEIRAVARDVLAG